MKTIIAGSRDIDITPDEIFQIVRDCGLSITEVVSGKQRTWLKHERRYIGADYCGEQYAKASGLDVKAFPADWDTHKLAAGPIRNKQMAEYADALILIWTGSSRGSASMLGLAESKGLVIVQHIRESYAYETRVDEGKS